MGFTLDQSGARGFVREAMKPNLKAVAVFIAFLDSSRRRSKKPRPAWWLLAAFLALAFAPVNAPAQSLDPKMWITNGEVNAVARLENTIYLGGTFTYVGPSTGGFARVDITSGATEPDWPSVHGAVRCTAADGEGGWYIGGDFRSVGGVARANLAHIRADRTLDSWNPGADNLVQALVISGSTVYAGGYFTTVGGQSRSHIAALDATTGLATDWNPGADRFGVFALAVSGSIVYVGGDFENIGGQSRSCIAALDSATGHATAWDPRALSPVLALAVSGNTVYVGGMFETLGGQVRRSIGAVDTRTGIATAWNPNSGGEVRALVVRGSKVYAGGGFSGIGGQARRNLAALDASTGLATSWNPGVAGRVFTVAANDSTVFVGGDITAGGQPETGVYSRANLVAFDATTGLVTPWNPGTDSYVTHLALSGSKVFVGGGFQSLGGVRRDYLAALDATTGIATDWDPKPNMSVNSLAVRGSTVYVGGRFFTIGGQFHSRVAALDATTGVPTAWSPQANGLAITAMALSDFVVYVGGDFNAIGEDYRSHIAAIDLTTGFATAWDPGANNNVRALQVSGSTVYAGGDFVVIGGQSRDHVAALNAGTGVATPWNPGANNVVKALALGGATVYAGGEFTLVGGQARRYLAALDATTGFATEWNPNPVGVDVSSLTVDGSTVYAGGNFQSIGGVSLLQHFASLSAVTGLAVPWDLMAGGAVNSVLVDGSTFYTGGSYFSADGQNKRGFAAFLPEDVSPPLVHALVLEDSSLFVIGTQRQLSWSAFDDRYVESVDLYLSRSGPAGPWEVLAEAAPNTGSYLWNVTGPAVGANNAFLRVVARDYSGNLGVGISDIGFSISTGTVVPTLLSLVDYEAEPGKVTLRWQSTDATSLAAVVERSVDREVWVVLGAPRIEGTDLLVYDDESVTPGRFSYRLRYVQGSIERISEPVWVDVPSEAKLALEGFRPNPALQAAAISFSLPDGRPTRLQVHDVRGRVVFSRQVSDLGPGTHLLRLDGSRRLAAGIYWIRLVRADRDLTAKGIVIR